MTSTTDTTPKIGDLVLYSLSEADVANIQDTAKIRSLWANHYVHGDLCPMMITRAWVGQRVNGKLLLDADFDLVVTSRSQGERNGCWRPRGEVVGC